MSINVGINHCTINTMQLIVFAMRYLASGESLVQLQLNSFFHRKCSSSGFCLRSTSFSHIY